MKKKILIPAIMAITLLGMLACASTGPDDQQIASQVRENLASNVDLASQMIDVSVTNGMVTLTGEVANQQQKVSALAAASGVVGESHVIDMLRVPDGRFGGETPTTP